MKLDSFKVFDGQHCETTSIGSILQYEGLCLSEPMLFGIGSGLGYIYWNMKTMPAPLLGGRSKVLINNLCSHLKVELDVKETASVKKAWNNVEKVLKEGRAVGLQLDCYHLDYFTNKIHFAGHHASIYGYDSKYAYLNDTAQQGGLVKTTLENLQLARSEKGPMSARNKSYSVKSIPGNIDLQSAIRQSIKKNAKEYLNPPITNIGFKGILKTSKEIKKWLKSSSNPPAAFAHTATMMEKAGTGGALFRTMYRDFLAESYKELEVDALGEAGEAFDIISKKWTNVADLFVRYSETENQGYINEASDILVWISEAEKSAVELLAKTFV